MPNPVHANVNINGFMNNEMTRYQFTDTKYLTNRCIICKCSKRYTESDTFREDGILRDSHFFFTDKGAVCEACQSKRRLSNLDM